MALLAAKRWKFPVTNNDKDKPSENHYYRSLLLAKNGFYPVSLNKQIHTGIHFDSNVLKELGCKEHNAVSCIADGEVIAYRVDGHYPKVDYDDKVAFFSTGFVLVRHLLEMELAPEATKETTNKTGEKKEEKKSGHRLYFYSLYMHLADTAYYDKNPKEPTPAFWEQDIYRVIDEKLEKIVGLRIREKANGTIKAVLQKGTKVNLNLNLHDKSNKWYAVTSLVTGYTSIPELTPFEYKDGDKTEKILGWIYTGKAVSESVFEIKEGTDSNFAKSKGLPVKDESGKKVISMLPIDTQIKVTGTEGKDHTIELTEIIRNGQPTIPLPKGKKKVNFASLEKIPRGKKYDEVVVLEKSYPIKAGDLVGHIGHVQPNNDFIYKEIGDDGDYIEINTLPEDKPLKSSNYKPLLHIECFTCEDLSGYITQTQTEAGKLSEEDKLFVAVSKKAKLLPNPNKEDTTVGKPYKDTKIKVISKNVSINWIQIEIKSSEEETKKLWIKNDETIAKTAKPNGEIVLNENTVAWSQHPLQVNELTKSTQIVGTPLLLSPNDKEFAISNNQAIDDQDVTWYKIKALDEKNLPIIGWVSTKGNDVKKVSAWEWFDFTQITENASLLEFYQNVKLSDKRNRYDASLDKYKPTLKATLSILDKQYPSETKQCAYIKDMYFNRLSDKPILNQALGRLLVNYESEWYSEIDAEGKMPKWEALNSEFTDLIKNMLEYFENGDDEKKKGCVNGICGINDIFDKEEEIRNMLEQKRNEIQRNMTEQETSENDTEIDSKEERINDEFLNHLQVQFTRWEKEKEKIKKMLWWDDVVKGLANQKQPTVEDNTGNKKGTDTNNQTAQTETKTPPAKLNQDGKAWFIHPISIINYFSVNRILFRKGDQHEIIREINIRLAGFGGNVPTDEFTERTENMIKQFQRDYMKVEETGLVDMKVIEAIDKFQEEYAISDTVWSQIKCKCGKAKCNGFGNGEGQNTSPEQNNPYEFPGIHRSLLFGLCSLKYYLSKQDVYKFREISSGYRCSRHSIKTKNHRGKALDIQFNKGTWEIRSQKFKNIEPLKYIRDNFFVTYLNTQNKWDNANLFSTEPIGLNSDDSIIDHQHTFSWIHMDVRTFEKKYLLDEYFCTDATSLNKEKLTVLIKK